MKKLLASVVLLAHFLASGEILYQNDFSGKNALDGWRKNRAAQLTGRNCGLPWRKKRPVFPQSNARLTRTPFRQTPRRFRGNQGGKTRTASAPFLYRNSDPVRRRFRERTILLRHDDKPGRQFRLDDLPPVCHAPADLKNAVLAIGMQGATGSFQLRNLKIESLGVPLPLTEKANMGYSDTVAGDGKGGWSDQGAENDGSLFLPELYRKEVAGVPFLLNRQGNSVLSFSSTHFPQGLKTAEFAVGEAAGKASWLYLLHTLCWGGSKEEEAGRIEIHGGKRNENIFRHQPARCSGLVAVGSSAECIARAFRQGEKRNALPVRFEIQARRRAGKNLFCFLPFRRPGAGLDHLRSHAVQPRNPGLSGRTGGGDQGRERVAPLPSKRIWPAPPGQRAGSVGPGEMEGVGYGWPDQGIRTRHPLFLKSNRRKICGCLPRRFRHTFPAPGRRKCFWTSVSGTGSAASVSISSTRC